MLHPSTRRLIDRLAELTEAQTIDWTEGEAGACLFVSGDYKVELVIDPVTVTVYDDRGRPVEQADVELLAATPHEADGDYRALVSRIHGEAIRVAIGAERAISTLLNALDLKPVSAVKEDKEVALSPPNTEQESSSEDSPVDDPQTAAVGTPEAVPLDTDTRLEMPHSAPLSASDDQALAGAQEAESPATEADLAVTAVTAAEVVDPHTDEQARLALAVAGLAERINGNTENGFSGRGALLMAAGTEPEAVSVSHLDLDIGPEDIAATEPARGDLSEGAPIAEPELQASAILRGRQVPDDSALAAEPAFADKSNFYEPMKTWSFSPTLPDPKIETAPAPEAEPTSAVRADADTGAESGTEYGTETGHGTAQETPSAADEWARFEAAIEAEHFGDIPLPSGISASPEAKIDHLRWRDLIEGASEDDVDGPVLITIADEEGNKTASLADTVPDVSAPLSLDTPLSSDEAEPAVTTESELSDRAKEATKPVKKKSFFRYNPFA